MNKNKIFAAVKEKYINFKNYGLWSGLLGKNKTTSVVTIMGGLGNQLFQYAFARALEIKRGHRVFLDKEFYKSHKQRTFKLNDYKVIKNIGWPYEVVAYDETGEWYGVAVNLESNVSRLHKELFDKEDYIPSDYVKNIDKIITEKTGI